MAPIHLDFIVNQKYTNREFLYILLFHIVACHYSVLTNAQLTFWKLKLKMKIISSRTPPSFPTASEMFSILVLFDVTSLSKNIRIINTLNMIKDHVNNDDEVSWTISTLLVLPTNWWRSNRRTSIFNYSRNLYAVSRVNCNVDGTTPSKSLGTVWQKK